MRSYAPSFTLFISSLTLFIVHKECITRIVASLFIVFAIAIIFEIHTKKVRIKQLTKFHTSAKEIQNHGITFYVANADKWEVVPEVNKWIADVKEYLRKIDDVVSESFMAKKDFVDKISWLDEFLLFKFKND